MTHSIRIESGRSTLALLLRDYNQDFRRLDPPSFGRWLEAHLVHWRKNPIFRQRVEIREIYRAHPRLRQLERDERESRRQLASTPAFAQAAMLARQLADNLKAQTGLSQAIAAASSERRLQLEQKLARFHSQHQTMLTDYNQLRLANPMQQKLLDLEQQVQAERAHLSLDREAQRLDDLLRSQGQASGRSGEQFEKQVQALIGERILPRLQAITPDFERFTEVQVLHGVRLGSGPVEFDQLVVGLPPNGGAVRVLAAIEVKRNLNDLAHGFRQRQENLAWFTGARDGYDSERYRNRNFPTGHFDRAARHEHEGRAYLFDAGSFALFQRDTTLDYFLDRLLFVSRPMTLWGLSSASLNRLAYRVATDPDWQPEAEAYMARLYHWCVGLTQPLETPDVLTLYASDPVRADQILLVEPECVPT